MRLRGVVATMLWTLAFVVVLDIAVGLLFRYPDDNRIEPGLVVRYFEYGRSVEGKLQRLLGRDGAAPAEIVSKGWIATECTVPITPAAPGRLGVTSYGMSFTDHIAGHMAEVDPSMTVARRSAPSASLNHSYACFRAMHDAKRDPNPIQVIGVLASSVDRTLTLTALTTTFEAPQPFTYPRYRLDAAGALAAEQPSLTRSEELKDPQAMKRFLAQAAVSDRLFDPFLIDVSVTDHSVLFRLLRRAYAQHETTARRRALVADAAGYLDNPEIGPVLSALLVDFAARVRAEGGIPIVLLLQDRPGVDALYRLLGPGLVAARVPFVSTHDIVPTTDPANFVSDGHFKPEQERRVAEKVVALVREELARRDRGAPPTPR